jgi:hypothetical protein
MDSDRTQNLVHYAGKNQQRYARKVGYITSPLFFFNEGNGLMRSPCCVCAYVSVFLNYITDFQEKAYVAWIAEKLHTCIHFINGTLSGRLQLQILHATEKK